MFSQPCHEHPCPTPSALACFGEGVWVALGRSRLQSRGREYNPSCVSSGRSSPPLALFLESFVRPHLSTVFPPERVLQPCSSFTSTTPLLFSPPPRPLALFLSLPLPIPLAIPLPLLPRGLRAFFPLPPPHMQLHRRREARWRRPILL